jgi:subtilase family serine protease
MRVLLRPTGQLDRSGALGTAERIRRRAMVLVASIGRRAVAMAAPLILITMPLAAAGPASQASGHFTPAVGINPHYRNAGQPTAIGSDVVFSCQLPESGFPCYGPSQIRHAYSIDALPKSVTGAGRTIVIIDAFQDPFIGQELADFDTVWGIPDPPSFKIVAPDGLTPFDPNDDNMVGWSGEIALDVQWAHAIAQKANIVLVLAKSNEDADIVSAMAYAIHNNLGDVVSMSFGEGESCFDPKLDLKQHILFVEAALRHITLVASSGDDGAAQPGCKADDPAFLSASTPANDPTVLGVGGTNLTAALDTGDYQSEVAWDDGFGQSGGGFSTRYFRPLYQIGFNSRFGRGVPDVSYNGGVFGGVIVAWYAFGPGAFFIFGGTSAGAPQWAGITALADQANGRRLGWLNPQLYNLARTRPSYAKRFHDITTGNNIVAGIGGYTTSTGWDPVTGLGSPIASALIKGLTT